MKTVDLIPFILLELNEQDKYGFELTKAIETKSNGKIIVKQPTLYTVLKKLEKSKFISSYWEDSEIGGKRHYYKLTEFGKLQVSTLPSVEQLIAEVLADETEVEEANTAIDNSTTEEIKPKEAIIPSQEVFSDNVATNPIDIATETDININNAEILKTETENANKTFAENDSVAKFTEINNSVNTVVNLPTHETTTLLPELDAVTKPVTVAEPIKYVDYKNFKKDVNYIKSNKVARSILNKSIITSACLITVLIVFNLLTKLSGSSPIFYIFWISALVFAIFYPIVTALQQDKIKEKYATQNFAIKNKKFMLINCSAILLTIVVALIVNIAMGNTSFTEIMGFSNFENLYAPVLLSCFGLVDLLICNLIFKNKSK